MSALQGEPSLSSAERDRVAEVRRHEAAGAAGVAALVRGLGDPSWGVRRSVVAALARLGDAAVGALRTALREERGSEAKIAACIDALVASTGDVDAALIDLLHRAEDPMIACDAAQVLGRRRSERALPALAARAQDPNDNVAVAAIEALGRIGGTVAIEPLLAAVKSGNFFRVFPAVDVLGRTGDPRATAALTELLDEPLYRREATRALGRTGDPAALPPLIGLLSRSGDSLLRVAAAALVELHDRAEAAHQHQQRGGAGAEWASALAEVVSASLTALRSRPSIARRLGHCAAGADAAEQAALCRVLAWIGGEAAIAALLELLDAEPRARQAAGSALRAAGREAEPMLSAGLRERGSSLRGRILPLIDRGSALVPEVIACLDDPDATVRAHACDALGRAGDPSATAALYRRLEDEDAYVVHAATCALFSIGGADAEALALRAARSPAWTLRRAGLQILGHLGSADGIDLLLAGAIDPDERIREAALQGLPSCADPRAIERLLAAAQQGSPRTRAAATRALGRCSRDVRRIPALLRGLGDPDPWVRYYACQALGRLREREADDALSALLDDGAIQVRLAAVEALGQIDTPRARAALHLASRAADPEVRQLAERTLGG